MWGWPLDVWDNVAFWTLVWGSVLAGIGIALTGFSSFVSLRTSGLVQQEADRKIADARAISDQANASAALSDERSKSASEGTAAALERAAKLEKEAAVARLEYEKLKSQMAWRQLTPDQQTKIQSIVRFSQPSITKITAISTDPESLLFAGQIQSAIASGGVVAPLIPNIFITATPIVGIVLHGRRDTITKFGQSLKNIGLAVTGIELDTEGIEIVVGSKPQ